MQLMTQLSWPVVLACCFMATAAVLANMISLVMIGKINTQLPEGQRLSYIWWGTGVRKRFKGLFPGSKLIPLQYSCEVIMFICFIVLVRFWVFG